MRQHTPGSRFEVSLAAIGQAVIDHGGEVADRARHRARTVPGCDCPLCVGCAVVDAILEPHQAIVSRAARRGTAGGAA